MRVGAAGGEAAVEGGSIDKLEGCFARIGKAASSPKRLELLDLLCQSERTVETLASAAGMSVANTSQHLHVLRAARLVEAEKEGVYVKYRLADEGVCEFFRNMRLLAEKRLAEERSREDIDFARARASLERATVRIRLVGLS